LSVSEGSLRKRLVALSLATLAPSLAILALTQHQVSRARHAEVQELAVWSARQAGFELDRIIAGVKILLIAVSQVPDVREGRVQGCNTYIARLGDEMPYLTSLTFRDPAGRLQCGFSQSSSIADKVAGQAYFRDALKKPEAVIGEYEAGLESVRSTLPIALAVRGGDGQPTGVLIASLDLFWLGEMLKERGLPPGGSITVADRNGVIIARQPLPALFVGTKIPDPYMRLLTAPKPGWEDVISQDGARRVLGYTPLAEPPVGLYVSVGLSSESSYQAVNAAARLGAMIALAGAIATLGATWAMGDRVFVRPIRQVTGVLRRWRAGDRGARNGASAGSGELGVLGAELDRLMDEIERGEQQRDLLARELEHRIKNTLATVQALAATTMNRPTPGKDLLPDFLARIAALARTHEVLTRERWEAADLRTLLLDTLRPVIGDIEQRVRLDGPTVELPPGQALGMTMVVHELCTNAVKYGALGHPSGSVDVDWRVRSDAPERRLELTWREKDGPPVAAPTSRTGFGARLIARALSSFGRTALEFDPAGLICRIDIAAPAAKPVDDR
jgi:two-component sensor histidine kinase